MGSGHEPTRGRGATSNPQGRFELERRASEDDGWYGGDGEPPPLATTVTIERAGSIIVRNRSPDVPFDLSINPYRGCEHGCVYCYARPNHSYLGLSPGLDFETKLFAKADAAALLRTELAARSYRCEPINLGSVTDAYQPIEREHRITRAVVEVLEQARHPVTVITKSALIERDIDLWASLAHDRLALAYVTITTLDPGLARRWEPRAAAPWRRLETIRRLSEAGIPVGVSVAPVAPFINEPELESVLAAAHEAGARHAQYMVLRLPHELADVFTDWLRAHYPDRAERVLNRLREMRRDEGGSADRINDPRFFTRMKGTGKWAQLIAMRFDLATRKLGFHQERVELRCDLFQPPSTDGQMALFAPGPPAR